VETFRAEFSPCQVFCGIKALCSKIGGVFAAVTEVPHAQLCVIMADIREQNGCVCHQFENLHCQGGIHVSLGTADDHFLGLSVGSIGIIQEGFGHICRCEMLG